MIKSFKSYIQESHDPGMSFNDAITHAKKHGHKVTYGTASKKWHSVGKDDRDYHTSFSLDPDEAKRHGMARSLLMSTQARKLEEAAGTIEEAQSKREFYANKQKHDPAKWKKNRAKLFRHVEDGEPSKKDMKESLDVPTPSVEAIAKKHGVSVEKIEDQLKKGIEVEQEHTTRESDAREIALDHLNEKPDYYTKLNAAKLEESIDDDSPVSQYLQHHNLFRKYEHEVGSGKIQYKQDKEHHREKASAAWEKLSSKHRKQIPSHMHWTSPSLHEEYKVGDTVVPKIGPHKGRPHEVIHVHGDGKVNIKPKNVHPKYNRYRLGAATADPKDLDKHVSEEKERSKVDPDSITHHFITAFLRKAAQQPGAVVKKDGKVVSDNKTVKEATDNWKEGLEKERSKESEEARKELLKRMSTPKKPKVDESTVVNNPIVAEAFKSALEKKKKSMDIKKPEKIEVKGPGANDKFQDSPIVTPLTTTFTRTP